MKHLPVETLTPPYVMKYEWTYYRVPYSVY